MKKRLGTLLVALVFCFSFSLTAVAKETPSDVCNTNEWDVLKIVNKERMDNKLQPISTFSKIQSACDIRATEIAKSFSHTRPNGTSCFTVLREKNINYWSAGENIAAGYQSPSHVMEGWMNSPGHRANILGSSFDHCGVGFGYGGYYGTNWVQLFVGGCEPESIKVCGPVSSAKPGMSIEEMNLYLEITCSDSSHGTSYCPIISKMCSGYSQSKTAGQTVTVKYQGKSTTFNVGKTDKPAQVTSFKKVKVTKSSAKLSWKKVKGAGYEIQVREGSTGSFKFSKKISSYSTTSTTISKLKKNKTYYFRIRAYKNVSGKKVTGKWSTELKVKTPAK